MSHHESAVRGTDARMADRMLFFSDAVFAIVLTILVLELRAPETEDGDAAIWASIGGLLHHFASFAISFTLVAVWWAIHMRMTRRLQAFDWPTAIFNLVFLFTISLVPFAASVFGAHISSGAALALYWMVSAAAGYAMTALFLVMSRGGGRLIGGIGVREWIFRFMQSIGPAIAFTLGAVTALQGELAVARVRDFHRAVHVAGAADMEPQERSRQGRPGGVALRTRTSVPSGGGARPAPA